MMFCFYKDQNQAQLSSSSNLILVCLYFLDLPYVAVVYSQYSILWVYHNLFVYYILKGHLVSFMFFYNCY